MYNEVDAEPSSHQLQNLVIQLVSPLKTGKEGYVLWKKNPHIVFLGSLKPANKQEYAAATARSLVRIYYLMTVLVET